MAERDYRSKAKGRETDFRFLSVSYVFILVTSSQSET